MKYKFEQRIVPFIICVAMACTGCLAVYTKSEEVSPGLTYTRSVTYDGKERETEFIFEYDPKNKTAIEFLYGNGVYGFSTLGRMIKNAQDSGKNVVGGINADFFAPQTGVPMSAMIVDGELISSDDDKPALGFDEEGNAFIGYPSIEIKISGEEFSYEIGHVNKTPTEYAPYLLTDKFGNTTRTKYPSTEIVLMPVTEIYSEEIYNKYLDEFAFDIKTEDSNDFSEIDPEIKEDIETETNDSFELKEQAEQREAYSESSESTEIIKESDDEIHGNIFDFSEYFSGERLSASSRIEAVVTEIRYSCVNGEIPEGAFVLTVDDRPYKNIFSVIQVGQKYVIETSCAEKWESVFSAIGGGSMLLRDGEACEMPDDYIYKVKNPRSSVGIKEDGTLVFFAVDGRRSGYSDGMTAKVLSKRLQELGCVDAMNFDGGGSVTVYSALPGMETQLANRPSDNAERAISNSVVFLNGANNTDEIGGFYMELDDFYVLGGGNSYALPKEVYVHDKAYFPLGSLSADEYVLSTDSDIGGINEYGHFVSGDAEGICEIMCTVGDITEKAATVYITNSPDTFKIDASAGLLCEETPVALKASASKDLLPVHFDFEKLWCSVNGSTLAPLPFEDENFCVSKDGIVSLKSTGSADACEIILAAGDKCAFVNLEVYRPLFYDMQGHWAKEVAEEANRLGIMEGMTGNDGRILFKPDSQIVLAQLCAMMSRFLGIDKEKYNDFDFDSKGLTVKYDSATEWALPYVASLFDAGILNPFIVYNDFAGMSVDITSQVSRADAMRMIGYVCPALEVRNEHFEQMNENDEEEMDETSNVVGNSSDDNIFDKYSDISELESDPFAYNIAKALQSDVFTGFPDGTMRPGSTLSRAQMAAVFVRVSQNR